MRLEVRVSLWLLVLFGLAGVVAMATTTAFERQGLQRQFQSAGQVLALAVENSLEVSMLNNSPHNLQQAIADVPRGSLIRSVSVYQRAGSVWASSTEAPAPTGTERHALLLSMANGTPMTWTDEETLTVFVPVANQARCARCHDEEGGILGAVGVSLDEGPLRSELARSTRDSIYVAAVPLFLGLVVSLWAIRRSLLRPLAMVGRAAERLATGDLSVRLPNFKGTELSSVAETFNDMAARLQHRAIDLTGTVEQLRSDLEGMEQIQTLLASGAGLPEVLSRTACHLGAALGAVGVGIWRCDAERPEATWGDQLPPGDAVRLAVDGRIRTSEGALADIQEDRTVSWVVAPAVRGGTTAAVMGIAWDPPRSLGKGERELLRSLAGVVGVAVENADLLKRLRQDEENLEGLLKKTLAAQEEERRRVARELHDETSQILSALIMNIETLQSQVPYPEPLRNRLEAAKALAEEAARNLDKVMLDLRPALLDELGLVAALRWYVSQFQEMWGLPVEFTAEGVRRPPEHVEVAAFRIVQEALANVGRHARAGEVHVRVVVGEHEVRAEVEDDGIGFDVVQAMGRTRTGEAAGLMGMRERAELLGGRLQVESRLREGTRILAEIPLPGTEGL